MVIIKDSPYHLIDSKHNDLIEPYIIVRNGKSDDKYLDLIKSKKNVIINEECLFYIPEEFTKEYNLYIEENINWIKTMRLTKADAKIVKEGIVNNEYKGCLSNIKTFLNRYKPYFIKGTILVRELNLLKYKSIHINSYLFETSFMAQYFKYNKVEYTIERVDDTEFRSKALSLINLYKGKRNDFANNARALSKNWTLKLTKEEAKTISINTAGWFKYDCDNDSKLNGWSTFKKAKQSLKGKGYTKGFIPCNCKGTNEFAELQSMAYLLNIYIKPEFMDYFTTLGLDYSQDDFALSMLIQWIWRSRIRNGETINLFLPSSRMRTIFTNYLNAKVSKPLN